MSHFEEFHASTQKEEAGRVARLFRVAGIRIQERVITYSGYPVFMIAVHAEDLERAEQIFKRDLGPSRTFTTGD